MRLSLLKFKAGPTPVDPPLEVPTQGTVILVGPNNSGKSLGLREIESWCMGENIETKVVDSINLDLPADINEAQDLLKVFKSSPPKGQAVAPGQVWVSQHTLKGNDSFTQQVELQTFDKRIGQALSGGDNQYLRAVLLKLYTVRLDGRTRFELSDPKPSGDLQSAPTNHLWSLFKDDEAREQVRKLGVEAFDLHFVIDPTGMQQFRIRMSERSPKTKTEEQALDEVARTFHSNAELVSDLSDGVQAFTGLASAVHSLPHRILLIDEPEAFLHPPLARRLGNHLSEVASAGNANLLVSTHSAEFVMGCVESEAPTTIVRLTYDKGVASARSLAPNDVNAIMKDPLLRSTKAIQALFHRAAVVAEADTDRAFYDEVNQRLQRVDRGVDDCLFVNAQNWQTIARVIDPLRKLGVPAAAILDLDTVAASEAWTPFYRAAGLDESSKKAMETARATARTSLKKSKTYKKDGLDGLGAADRAKVESFIGMAAKYGLFVVEVGELESWLKSLGVTVSKSRWLPAIFDAMGMDGENDYLSPESDDVWSFVDSISSWTSDPNRLGIPTVVSVEPEVQPE